MAQCQRIIRELGATSENTVQHTPAYEYDQTLLQCLDMARDLAVCLNCCGTWVAAMRISPFFGVHRLFMTPISSLASALAS